MMGLIIRIFGGKVQAIVFVVLVTGAFLWYRHAMAVSEQRGYDNATEAIGTAERKRINAEMDVQRAEIERERLQLDAANSQLQIQRRDIQATLNRGLSQLAGRDVEIRNEVSTIPDAAVNLRFRDAIVRARIADTKLAGIRSAPTQ